MNTLMTLTSLIAALTPRTDKITKGFIFKDEKICYKMVLIHFVFRLYQSSEIVALESYADEKPAFLKGTWGKG